MKHSQGASSLREDRATHERSQSSLSSPSVGVPLRVDVPGGDVVLFQAPDLGIDPTIAFNRLRAAIPWKAREISIGGRSIMQPRLTSWHADAGVTYTYSGRTHHPAPWTPLLLRLKEAVEMVAGAGFNSVLLNLYPNERASIGWHSDDEPELGRQPVIASVSLGADREFRMRPYLGGKTVKIPLTHGSVLVMRGDTQSNWQHGIEKSRVPCGERINLTFRMTHAIAIEAAKRARP
jgi:alkylated DNA repair dioxygenase AlkB